MKKFILVFALCFLSLHAVAEEKTCNEGTLITANAPTDAGCTESTCNGHVFL